MKNRITPERIEALKDNEIFVFGSNLSGYHGGGAAKLALDRFGALYRQAFGIQGKSFAIPTKDKTVANTLNLEDIQRYVDTFIYFAQGKPELTFLVTEIGCGLAGLTPEEVAPLFKDAIPVENIYLPKRFWQILNNEAHP